jgi:hypothetical protein
MKPQTSSTRIRGLGRRIHGSVEDTKLSTNKQHTLSLTLSRPSRREWQMQASSLDGEAQSQARLSQHQRRARVRREAQEAALGHAGGGEQGRCSAADGLQP